MSKPAVLVGALIAAAAFACAAAPGPGARSPSQAPQAGLVSSNVLRGDYAGSEACGRCHADMVERWRRSPMHNMTRELPGAVVLAPFTGTALRFKEDRVDLEQHGDARFVRVISPRFGDALYRVTRVIGGHHREDYAGVEVKDVNAAPRIGDAGDELILPISYLIATKRFRYKGYSVMSKERPGLRAGPAWARTCILCHNTSAQLTGLLASLPHAERGGYQGVVVDALLPSTLRWKTEVVDARALDAALKDEIERLGGNGDTDARVDRAIAVTRVRFSPKDLIEVGIGCESCHGGSKAHAEEPTVHTSLLPQGAGVRVVAAGDAEAVHAQSVTRTCARCHQVLFSRYPYTWEGGRRDQNPGGSNINSGEARDFLLGSCTTRATCTDCHDPHAESNRARASTFDTPAGDAVCVRCHGKYAGAAAQRAHTHHDPEKPGGRCVACHMPQKNMSLDGGLGRYHRIGSPTDALKSLDRPLECALCHGDKTVGAILDDMQRLFGKTFEATAQRGLYGSLDANVLEATLAKGKPHEKAVALHLLGERRARGSARAIARELVGEYPVVRTYADVALGKIFGTASPLDLNTADDEIRTQAAAWLARENVP